MSEAEIRIYLGNIIHCIKPFTVEVLENNFIAVCKNKIIKIENVLSLEDFKKEHEKHELVVLDKYQILIPGLIDTHHHAAQYPNLGLGLNKPLNEWLETHAYPLQEKFGNLDLARQCYETVVRSTLNNGSTTVAYNATIHTDAALVLADTAIAYGQRAFVGKVNITINSLNKNYCETENETIAETERFINEMLNKKSTLVLPIITPVHPFRISMSAMQKLTVLAKTHNLSIQTHMCECNDEIEKARKLFKKSFSEILIEGGVLTDQTIVAHAIHTSSGEVQQLAKYKTSVAHCPGSNFNLLSGICDVKVLFEAGVNVGLGTDISAGSNVGITDQMRNAMIASSALYFNDRNRKPISCYDTFYMATLGGAKALSIDKVVGNFKVGKDFDALIVDMNVKNGNSSCILPYDPFELLQKFIYLGDDRNIVSVFVAGRNVKSN
ncbi:hypothetical protein FQR65_LT07844 [Abscondita terminalis]|nr:hypothetical protein FQR65_LT07844 [Abscondita terminalis]